MSAPVFVRARRPEQKQQRREAILVAARDLAREAGVSVVSLGALADRVGLAKSNLSRYFGTREEIYLELLAQEWQDWAHEVTGQLRDVDDTPSAVAVLAQTLVERRLFCDLLSHSSTSLEQNVSVLAARTFKHTVHDVVAQTGAAVGRATGLTDREGSELVAMASGLAGTLYPAANPPEALRQLYTEDPVLAAARPEVLPTLVRMLTALAAGLPTLRDRDAAHPSPLTSSAPSGHDLSAH